MSSRPELKVHILLNLIATDPNFPQVDDEGGFIKFFKALPVKEDDTIRVFERSDFYTAHGDDASFIARTVCLESNHKFHNVLTDNC